MKYKLIRKHYPTIIKCEFFMPDNRRKKNQNYLNPRDYSNDYGNRFFQIRDMDKLEGKLRKKKSPD